LRQSLRVLPSFFATDSMAATTFFLRFALVSTASNSRSARARQDCAGPGAEILGREVLAGDLAEVVIDVQRARRMTSFLGFPGKSASS
jgi:hypothetical protein